MLLLCRSLQDPKHPVGVTLAQRVRSFIARWQTTGLGSTGTFICPGPLRFKTLATLTFADLLDAAGIASISVSAMDAAEWAALATAAGVHGPGPETCQGQGLL